MTDEQYKTITEAMKATGQAYFIVDSYQVIGLSKGKGIVSIVKFDTGVERGKKYYLDASILKFIKDNKITHDYEYFLNKTCVVNHGFPDQYRKAAIIRNTLAKTSLVAVIENLRDIDSFNNLMASKVSIGTQKVMFDKYMVLLYKTIIGWTADSIGSAEIYTNDELPYVMCKINIKRKQFDIETYMNVLKITK